MPSTPRLIKRSAPAGLDALAFEAVSPVANAPRIPGRQVSGELPALHGPAPAGELVRRVIRASEASVTARALELDSHDLTRETAIRRSNEPKADKRQQPPPKTVDDLKEEWDTAWQQRLEQAVATSRDEAFAQGYAEAQARLQEEVDTQKQALADDLLKLRASWEHFLEQSEPLLVELSFDIAQAVLDSPLSPTVKGVAARTLTEAVEQLSGTSPIEIALHPVDFLRLQESGLVDQLESLHAGIRWEPRPEMKHGDWTVQSPAAAIRRLEQELLGTLRSRLGLLAVAEKRPAKEHSDSPHSGLDPESTAE